MFAKLFYIYLIIYFVVQKAREEEMLEVVQKDVTRMYATRMYVLNY